MNNNEKIKSAASCPGLTIIFLKQWPTVHIKNSPRPFWISEEVQFKHLLHTQNKCYQILQIMEAPFFSALKMLTPAIIYYFLCKNKMENDSSPHEPHFFLHSVHFFYHMVTWWWQHVPPHHTCIHQSLGHVIVVHQQNYTDGWCVIVIVFFLFICSARL